MPAILSLYNSVVKEVETAHHLRRLASKLRDSLMTRFLGVFFRVNMGYTDTPEKAPFHHRIYCAAAVLDPNIKLFWIDEEIDDDEEKPQLKRDMQGILLKAAII